MFRDQRQERGLLQDLWDSFDGHRLILRRIQKYTPKNERVGELGAGRGYNLFLLSEKGYHAIAIDNDAQANADISALAAQLKTPVEIATVDFADSTKLPSAHTFFNSGVMEHFTPDQIRNLLNIWSGHCKFMMLSIPFKSAFSSLKEIHGDEKFYSAREILKIVEVVPSLELIEMVAYNHTVAIYNQFRKYVAPPGARGGWYRAADWFLTKLDFLLGNELLLILKSRNPGDTN